jgi:hypothetical protein
VRSWYELYDRRRAQTVNARLLAYVQQLKQVCACSLALSSCVLLRCRMI